MNHLMHPQFQSSGLHLARGLASLGRGPDTDLVHMSKKEIEGLKQLATAHGKQLTTNPHTGLLEAGWLDSILPMVAGAALTATGIGAPAAALMVGAASAAYTKDWKSGLAAGLGAFGGAGIATGLAGAGAAAGDAASGVAAGSTAGAGTAGAAGTTATAAPTGIAAAAPVAADTTAAAATDISPIVGTATSQGGGAGVGALAPVGATATDTAGATAPIAVDTTAGTAAKMPPIQGMTAGQQSLAANSYGQNVSNMGQGVKALATPGTTGSTASGIYANTGRVGLAGLAAPSIYSNYKDQQEALLKSGRNPFKYYTTDYNPGYANPNYGYSGQTPLSGQGYSGETQHTWQPVGYADGGFVQQPPPQSTFQVAPDTQGAAAPAPASAPPAWAQISMQPSVHAQSPMADQNYLAGLNKQLTGKAPVPQGIATPPPPPPAKSTTQPVPLSGAGPLNSSPALSYNPTTQRFTSAPGSAPSSSPYSGGLSGLQYSPTTNSYLLGSTGLAGLGGHAAGGQLKGPGDAMSDSIPAMIHGEGGKQPAALATDEFIIPGDVVSHLGNGSSDAGAKRLYAMMDRIRQARTGKKSQAPQINPNKFLPA